MSLSETRKLLQQSRKVVEEADENTSVTSILNMILNPQVLVDRTQHSPPPFFHFFFIFLFFFISMA